MAAGFLVSEGWVMIGNGDLKLTRHFDDFLIIK